jgi:hypothetical protein
VPQTFSMTVPLTPNTTQTMTMGSVGLAVNGVLLFDNRAAPGDDIYLEAGSFDRCGGHPNDTGYHYHSEPLAISQDDARLVGVLRDGYPIYGRRDADGSLPTLDARGGHTGVTVDSPGAPVYHYHLNRQVSSTAGSLGLVEWFVGTGLYRGTPGACSGC